uniref:Uncharacterized protein n=1 Tax=Aplanochytrium stocchinoi TaxID=215587 RepID=A0A7S3PNK7_9STRA|mmetsp:Transcript_14322/g.17692  ORF Transcript_14322/g.17692 Transcript_14322/m.17692 type:complete len:262 (+) Transcript_14322:53-838(+)|eukprot:CAMPEP_0204822094 /NCGR_PEP_ID=MMETSP1346-20131115/276_1 /ASSEMBLY_ACC=CAM_ASM_000771 /TAXON_ID=215587 /ORGANISM="Aplanochytrium stocchinoi, Strain GSBS06" /LENGTH=261 /DNA_ID=CAMNT_0051948119 /DNA_START=84 /DNA_END=872 /DNA_ORIENTATION=-
MVLDPRVETLVKAAGEGDLDTVRHIIKDGVSIHAINGLGVSALTNASMMGHADVVQFLLDNGSKGGEKWSVLEIEALSLACASGHLSVVKLLLGAGFVDLQKDTPGAIQLLHQPPPLVAASSSGHLDIVEYLLQEGMDPNNSKSRSYSSAYGEKGEGETALTAATSNGNLEVVKTLIASGADVNKEGKHGDTAYTLAKRFKHKDILEFLLQHGAKPSSKFKDQNQNKLNIGNFANLGLKLGKGPTNLVAESRDKGSVTRDV